MTRLLRHSFFSGAVVILLSRAASACETNADCASGTCVSGWFSNKCAAMTMQRGVYTGQLKEVTMIVKAGHGLIANAAYVISRYSNYDQPGEELTFDVMPKSSGRESLGVMKANTDKIFDLAYRIAASDATAVIIRIFGKHYAELGSCGENINASAIPKEGLLRRFKVNSGGHLDVAFFLGSAIEVNHLNEAIGYEYPANPIPAPQAVKIEDVTGYGPLLVGTAPLPENLQGLWWLTEQGSSTALISFAGPNNDGAGCSNGFIMNADHEYKVRVQGDRVFSTAQPTASDELLAAFDAVYKFNFNHASNPTFADIYSSNVNGGLYTGPHTRLLVNFKMTYMPDGDEEYAGSKIWHRESSILGSRSLHKLVQVIGGDRQKIEPAWSKFAEYMNSTETGWTPGWIFYRSDVTSPSVGAAAKLEEVHSAIRHRVILYTVLIWVFAVCIVLCLAGALVACMYKCCGGTKKKKKGKKDEASEEEYEEMDEEAAE